MPALRAAAHDYHGSYICALKTNTVQNTPINESIKFLHTKSKKAFKNTAYDNIYISYIFAEANTQKPQINFANISTQTNLCNQKAHRAIQSRVVI